MGLLTGKSRRGAGLLSGYQSQTTAPQEAIPRICRTDPNRLPPGNGYPGVGALSDTYETNGKGVNFVSNGKLASGKQDPGGPSVGPFQLSSRRGGWDEFLGCEGKHWAPLFTTWNRQSDTYDALRPGSPQFRTVIDGIARGDGRTFLQAQKNYVIRRSFEPSLELARQYGINISNPAIQNAIWSQAIQHGRTGSRDIIGELARNGIDLKDDGAVLDAFYSERVASNPRDRVRYENERRDAVLQNSTSRVPPPTPVNNSQPGSHPAKPVPITSDAQFRAVPPGTWVRFRGRVIQK